MPLQDPLITVNHLCFEIIGKMGQKEQAETFKKFFKSNKSQHDNEEQTLQEQLRAQWTRRNIVI